jgi:hypothetical protein
VLGANHGGRQQVCTDKRQPNSLRSFST